MAMLTQPLYLQFAGQAVGYLEELRELSAHPSAGPLVQEAADELCKIGEDECFGLELPQGLDVAAWLGLPSSASSAPVAAPDMEYLNCAPVAYPLITLTQLARLLATSHALGLESPTDLKFLGGFGHSSGILSCAVAALAGSQEDYKRLSVEAVVLAAYHGLRCQQHCPVLRPSVHVWKPQYVRQRPTPMLHVDHKGMRSRQAHLDKLIQQFNHHNRDRARQISVGLKNGPASVVVGAPESLHWLAETLSAALEKDQSRVPFSERTPELLPQFLDVTVPFHSPRLAGVDAQILADVAALPALAQLRGHAAARSALRFPVYSTADGEALRSFDLAKLVAMQTAAQLDWEVATQALASRPGYVLDMGPSLSTAKLTRFLHAGDGAVVVTATAEAARSGVEGLAVLLERRLSRVPPLDSWVRRFAPRLDAGGSIVTKFTKLVGRPPVLVPGMTPWSHAEQVAAVERAGYHAELAGGGIPLPGHFTKEVRKLALSIPPGAGITVNLLYLNAYLWGFQFPLVEKLALQGEPLESITVAAGIPSLEKLREIVESAKRARLNFITFKPGSASAIGAVLEVCAHFPRFQFLIQWTGGRSGGHHSFEDQYEPLLETYALIRSAENITLVVGGGLGSGADAYEWLSGDWSLRFGRPRMPVDAVLMGSRVLATAESATGGMTKDLLLAAKGVEEKEWELSFRKNGDAGGVITVQSELGEPIHVVKNRCSVLWREFDDRYFSLPREKMLDVLLRNKAEVIRRLNADFQKPWFGSLGGRPCDLGDMTYYDVCARMVDLMFLPGRGEWIDGSYRLRLAEMLTRTEERFVHARGNTQHIASLVDEAELERRPMDAVSRVFERYPRGRTARLLIEDQDYFVHSVCNPLDRKPVNFVPQLDINFKRYFKSDSLWFSETLHAVPEGDAERTFIIYGPVAAQSVRKRDETLAEVLGGVCAGIKEQLAKRPLPAAESPGDPDALRELAARDGVGVSVSGGESPALALSFGESACPSETYRRILTETDVAASIGAKRLVPGAGMAWVRGLFHGLVVRGDRRAPAPIARLLQPVPETQVLIAVDGQCICIRPRGGSHEEPAVRLAFAPDGSADGAGCVTVTLWHTHTAVGAVPLELQYMFRPSTPSCPLHEPARMRYSASTAFYVRVWEEPSGSALRESASWMGALSDGSPKSEGRPGRALGEIPERSVHALDQLGGMGVPGLSGGAAPEATVFRLKRAKLVDFCLAVGMTFPCFVAQERPKLPMDFAIVAGWTGLIAAVLRDRRVGPIDWLTLLHLENQFEELQVRHMKGEEDTFASNFELIEVTTTPSGKSIGVRGLVKHCGAPWVVVTTYFFVPTDIASREEAEEAPTHMKITNRRCLIRCDEGMAKVLGSKDYFQLEGALPPCDVVVEVHSKDMRSGTGPLHIEAHGTLARRCEGQDVPLGKVGYRTQAAGNALLAFLDRHAAEYPAYCALDSPYFVLETPDVTRSPLSMQRYSRSSGDWNPIHTDSTFASLAALRSPIVHGMWLSANARRVLAEHMGEQDARAVTRFKTQFVDKVPVGSHIITQVKHVGMRGGQCVVEVESRKLEDGQVCLKGTADIRQSKTLLTFTGQGSQFAGMGRELRQSSDVAKQLWDRAERHFMTKYGVSLLQIVDENPREKVVHFGGAEGARIREVYRKYVRKTPEGKEVPVFPSVGPESETYTFSHKTGLLNATQFTQPLLILTEMSQFLSLKEKQLIPQDCLFAGHSLGEYAAVFCVAGLMSLENLLDIVFMRGITMQVAVDRHEDGSSDFGMVAVNPSRVGKHFAAQDLIDVVGLLDSPGELLQIVNYNVEPRQYVCAGHVRALMALRLVLDEVASSGCSVAAAVAKHGATAEYTSFSELKGKATVPLEGIDVPFHSRQLRSGVIAFRQVLESFIPLPMDGYKSLENRYIPNLLGKPFSTSKQYVEMAAEKTSSPLLISILGRWAEAAADEAALARSLLVELLSYQFASPVLWSQTVEEAICRRGVTRFVEFGPGPVLKRMAKTALETTPALIGQGPVENLNFADSAELTFAQADRGPSTEDFVASMQESTAKDEVEAPAEVSAPPPAAAPAPAPLSAAAPAVGQGAAAASGPDLDAPVRAIDALRLIVGSRVGEVGPGKSLKQLVGGRSALQNELIGEIAAEFGSDPPENPAELPLEDLAKHWPSYAKLGKASTQLVSKVLLQTMPAGTSLNTARRQLEEEYAVTAATAEAVLLRAVPLAPTKRLSAAEASAWRASLVARFNAEAGVEALPRRSGAAAGPAAGAGAPAAAMDPKTAEKLRSFARDIAKAADDFLGPAPRPRPQELAAPLNLEAELGSKFAEGVQPMFFKPQVREYNDWWAIGQRRVRATWRRCEAGQLDLASEAGRRDARLAALASSEASAPLLSWLALHSKEGGAGRAFCEQVRAQLGKPPLFLETGGTLRPTVRVDGSGEIIYKDVPRHKSLVEHVDELGTKAFVSLRTRAEIRDESMKGVSRMVDDDETSAKYLATLRDIAEAGIGFSGRVALLTGLSPGSLTEPLAKMLLQGGATVISTMWWLRGSAPYDYFRSLYAENCGAGARLIVAPFNQACNQDLAGLVEYIYAAEKDGGLGLDVDYFVPFAALPERGHGVDDIDSFSELAHRVMLTNTVRMTGHIVRCKRERKVQGKTALCIMPLSPNHGVFGYDGLYAESKLGLESFFEKWHSERLKEHLSIVGATMGWVRGTNLMMANNIVASAMEERGCHTFTASEMAFNLIGLMHPDMVHEAQMRPIHALLTGKMERMNDLAGTTALARASLNARSAEVKLINADREADMLVESGGSVTEGRRAQQERLVRPRPYACYPARHGAAPPSAEQRSALAELKGMVDPASTVVITGFGEVGPWGDAWTRWEMERDGEFSIEGCVLLAWMLGFIKYFNGPQPSPKGPPVHYSGWVDVSSGKPVSYWDVKELYEEKILSCCGMRILDPAVLDGFDGTNTVMHHTVLLEQDLQPIEVDDGDIAREFAKQHGDLCDVAETASGTWTVRMLKGAKIFVPRSLRSDRWVCAQVPSHWNPRHFGIPEDIINQVDRVTLYALVGCAQALRESGVMDPYEFYEYVHLSQVGNAMGSGMGGLNSLKEMFTHRYHSDAKRVKGDVLQETFINTTSAWLNMLLLSSSGPIKTPVGACATTMESASIAVDTILSGQAKVMLVGAVDDLSENSSREFASMKATANADEAKLAGRQPSELSRPMSMTRSGFVESHGCGVMVFMAGDLALAMGAPIHAVVGCVHTATDHTGRSVPAPGQGVLSAVSEAGPPSPLLDMERRRALLEGELAQLRAAAAAGALPAADGQRLEALARRRWSLDWWQSDASVSRLRGALSVFGLTGDDITLASCHGTSTKLNDKNEASILQQEMESLGRTPGNPLYIVAQKWLTGHPKGPAAAWQMHGVMQAMADGVVPGNRNLDCVDPALRGFGALFFPREKVEGQFVSAALVNSFGFGQAGGQCLLVHPNYFLAAVEDAAFDSYLQRLQTRHARVFKHRQDIFGGRAAFVPIKSEDPHSVPFRTAILDKSVRLPGPGSSAGSGPAVGDGRALGAAAPRTALGEEAKAGGAVARALMQAAAGIAGPALSMGIDAEPVRMFEASFMERNFSQAERSDIAEHDAATATNRSAAGLWAAKEAVVKALGNAGAVLRGADEPLLDIGLHRLVGGSLRVELRGRARDAAEQLGVREARVSLTYADGTAFAAAILV